MVVRSFSSVFFSRLQVSTARKFFQILCVFPVRPWKRGLLPSIWPYCAYWLLILVRAKLWQFNFCFKPYLLIGFYCLEEPATSTKIIGLLSSQVLDYLRYNSVSLIFSGKKIIQFVQNFINC